MQQVVPLVSHLFSPSGVELRDLHRRSFIVLVSAVLSAHAVGIEFNPLDWPLVAGLVVLLLGVPHGGFDVALAERRWKLNSPTRLGIFLMAYISLAALIAAFWLIVPAFALPLFLVMAAYHFSGDWEGEVELLPRLVVGASIICAPAILYRNEVLEIFSWIAPMDAAKAIAEGMAIVGVPLIQAAIMITLVTAMARSLAAIEIAFVLLLGLLTPPLCFFLVYFCGLHSIRHTFAVSKELRPSSAMDLAKRSFPYAPIAIIGTILLSATLALLETPVELLGIVFVVLAGLTAPHMLLVDLKGSRIVQSSHLQ